MKPKEYEVIFKFTVASTVPFPSTLNWNAEPIGELIRCKECKHRYNGKDDSPCELLNMPLGLPEDFYCMFAERRGEE